MIDNLYAVLRSRFPTDARACALETETGRTLSFRDLDARSAQYAHTLGALGLAPGDRVMVKAEKSPESLLLYLACLRGGYVHVPLNVAYTESEMRHFLADAAPRVVFCAAGECDAMAALAQTLGVDARVFGLADNGGLALPGLATAPVDHTPAATRSDTVAALIYTSGTTGRPKGVMLSHDNLASNALALHRAWGFRPGDVLLHALPVFHVHGLFIACHTALLNGSTMLFLRRFDVPTVLRLLPRATVMMGVPTFYVRLLAEPAFDADSCRSMRLFISGSAPLLAETFTAFQARTGHTILERYGMSETGMNTSNPLVGERRAGTVGLPLEGVDVRIVDEAGAPVAAEVTGHVQVRGANVFRGYWRLPGRHADDFTGDGYFRTGDLGRLSDDGYLTLVGRARDLVISGGYNVYPKEVELVLDALPGVCESAVFGVPHPDFGEAVTAAVVPVAGSTLDAACILEHARRHLAAYKVPKQVFVVADLPRNAMGKVQKSLLRERHAGPA